MVEDEDLLPGCEIKIQIATDKDYGFILFICNWFIFLFVSSFLSYFIAKLGLEIQI